MASLTTLNRPIVRRLIREDVALVVRITNAGIELRGYRRRRWRVVTWERIASLTTGEDQPLFCDSEAAIGRLVLEALAPPAAAKTTVPAKATVRAGPGE